MSRVEVSLLLCCYACSPPLFRTLAVDLVIAEGTCHLADKHDDCGKADGVAPVMYCCYQTLEGHPRGQVPKEEGHDGAEAEQRSGYA